MTAVTNRHPWWKNYFSALYGKLYRGILAPELNTGAETGTLERLFKGVRDPVLDLGCGHGRHLAPLRRAGLPAVGLDYSMELLRQVPGPRSTRLVRGDMRHLPFATGSLAGAWFLFNSFGYFDEEENLGVLRELARVLRPGARLVMDLPLRSGMKQAVSEIPPTARHEDGITIYEAWTYNEEARRLEARGSWETEREQQGWELSIRLYTLAEFVRLLRRAGFAGLEEALPLEEFERLGTGGEYPGPGSPYWRQHTNAALLVSR